MPRCQASTVYIGNLDERVDERLLYEIMIQAGPLVEIHMPRDRETRRHKAYAFAEYKTQESAAYALGLFSGLVSLYNRSVKFAMSGQEKQINHSEDAKPLPGYMGMDRPSTAWLGSRHQVMDCLFTLPNSIL